MTNMIRPTIADGILYYNNPTELQNFVKSSIASNMTNKTSTPFALIAPNASYLLAGNAYGAAYSQLINEVYDTVIIISQTQKMAFYSIGLTESSAFDSPLGSINVDVEANKILKKYNPDFIVDGEKYHLADTSIELQLPYLLEVVNPTSKILPILMGEPNTKFTILLSKALKHLFETTNKRYLIIITTNLSSEVEYEKAKVMDTNLIKYIESKDSDYLAEQLALNQIKANSGGALVALCRLNATLGEKNFSLLKYYTTAEITEDRSKVEGYIAAAFYNEE